MSVPVVGVVHGDKGHQLLLGTDSTTASPADSQAQGAA